MGLFSRSQPKIKVENTKKDSYSGWIKCSHCFEMIHANELQDNLNCCPKCSYHYRLNVKQRMNLLLDDNSFIELFTNIMPKDPLKFVDSQKYSKRLKAAQEKTNSDEAIIVGVAFVNSKKVAIGIMDFSFMGGSMGSVVGEKITLLIEHATKKSLPLIIVSASGGARMQESILSLMQMAKTSAALTRLHKKRLPYISILTNPTTGGVTASFASLGDIIIAEPNALIAFAGPRVVEQTINQKLPDGAQKSEFLLEKGMIDLIVKRDELKKKISFFVDFLMHNPKDITSEKMPKRLKQLLKVAASKKTDEHIAVKANKKNEQKNQS
ncbi:MAG: Acetyl-coenzyme A carboxylase carboxyl transferase subunit beta [Candidatus Anoxychlamydiales bacterium]|nr:Acetyl-coenzyme A carboxylase carboxyl transferase subunit beta [Candidatus Anoxychlamydiales bacterium]NGX35741.1 Acetyl-coenzyme A carboxylase carboxyl transferase subunit beta [Candidatus Anoxychlamydiales bacterium]